MALLPRASFALCSDWVQIFVLRGFVFRVGLFVVEVIQIVLQLSVSVLQLDILELAHLVQPKVTALKFRTRFIFSSIPA